MALMALDKALHYYEALPDQWWPKRLVRGAALREAERWIVARQEADGSWGGIQPPDGLLHDRPGPAGLSPRPPGHLPPPCGASTPSPSTTSTGRRIEACQSPVWDTALAVTALLDAGAPPDDPAVKAARDWLLQKEVTVVGRLVGPPARAGAGRLGLRVRRTSITPTSTTRPRWSSPCARADAARTVTPPAGGRSTGWSACSARTAAGPPSTPTTPPSCPPSCRSSTSGSSPTRPRPTSPPTWSRCWPARRARPAGQEAMQRGLDWLRAHQEPDGSYWGRWGVNYVYGTGAVLPALIAAGVPAKDPRVADGARWLIEHQNADGGWGEDLRSYVEPGWHGRGTSTASQTAWALIGLLVGGRTRPPGHQRGHRVARGQPDRRRDLGRALVHRYRLPVGFLA